jgi:hypothetical protein
MTIPAYYDTATGVLTDGEAWVGISTHEPTGTKLVSMTSTDDGQVGDWSQYMDLVVVVASQSARTGSDTDTLAGYFNNDTGSNYASQYWYANGSTVTASSTTTTYMSVGNSLTVDVSSDISASAIWQIFDINSGKYKSSITQWAADKDDTGSQTIGMYAFTWKNQAAITEIDLNMWVGNYNAGTIISLFGILPRMVA